MQGQMRRTGWESMEQFQRSEWGDADRWNQSSMHVEPVKDPNGPSGGTIVDWGWHQADGGERLFVILALLAVAVIVVLACIL